MDKSPSDREVAFLGSSLLHHLEGADSGATFWFHVCVCDCTCVIFILLHMTFIMLAVLAKVQLIQR